MSGRFNLYSLSNKDFFALLHLKDSGFMLTYQVMINSLRWCTNKTSLKTRMRLLLTKADIRVFDIYDISISTHYVRYKINIDIAPKILFKTCTKIESTIFLLL